MARYNQQVADLIRMSDKRTPSALTASQRRQLSRFLYCEIKEAGDLMPVTPLSLFSRMNMEPWDEAQALSAMPEHAAISRLGWLIFSTTASHTHAEAELIAKHLLVLLPRKAVARASTGSQVAAIRRHVIVLTTAFTFGGIVFLQEHQRPPVVKQSPRVTSSEHQTNKYKAEDVKRIVMPTR